MDAATESRMNKDAFHFQRAFIWGMTLLIWWPAQLFKAYLHLYSPLDAATVVNEYELSLNEDGSYQLPDILKKYQFNRPK